MRLGPSKKVLSNVRGIGHQRRVFQPSANNFFQVRSDPGQFRQGATFLIQLCGFLGPEERFPRSPPEGLLQRLRRAIRFRGQQFTDVRIRERSLGRLRGFSCPTRRLGEFVDRAMVLLLYAAFTNDCFNVPETRPFLRCQVCRTRLRK